MAQRTITRLYDTHDSAAAAVTALEAAGIPHSDISIVAQDRGTGTTTTTTPNGDGTHTQAAGNGAGAGASVGTLLGGGAGLLAGLGALAIPGVGPVVAAGWLIATLTGAGVGAAAGGLLGSLTGAGVSEQEAHVYTEGVRRGGSLVTVRADEADSARIEQILNSGGAVDWRTREADYRNSGWERFDENAPLHNDPAILAPRPGDGVVADPALRPPVV